MPESHSAPHDAARPRFRGIVTTLLVIMIARDILVRRWGGATPPASGVTQHSP